MKRLLQKRGFDVVGKVSEGDGRPAKGFLELLHSGLLRRRNRDQRVAPCAKERLNILRELTAQSEVEALALLFLMSSSKILWSAIILSAIATMR